MWRPALDFKFPSTHTMKFDQASNYVQNVFFFRHAFHTTILAFLTERERERVAATKIQALLSEKFSLKIRCHAHDFSCERGRDTNSSSPPLQ